MKNRVFLTILLLSSVCAFAQNQINATELISEIREGKTINYENVIIVGDMNLANFGSNVQTAEYPENGKTAYVFTNFVKQIISFKNCTFKGKVILFDKTEVRTEIKEYRVEFADDVTFQNCVFEKATDFELTNFNKAISFENSLFNERPRFVRMGIYQKPNITGLKLSKGCLFQFDQSKKEKIFTIDELGKIIDTM